MPVLQQAGRIALSKSIADVPILTIHIAWGRGDPDWDAHPQPEPTDALALVDEIGRRRVTDISYVRPDPNGEIEMPGGDRYTVSPTPTAFKLLRATFGFEDAQGETVREVGVFFNSTIAPDVPEGQRWVLAGKVLAPGDIYTLERRPGEYRSGSARAVEEIILPF